jgi:uncharacterized protein (DUF305 family)
MSQKLIIILISTLLVLLGVGLIISNIASRHPNPVTIQTSSSQSSKLNCPAGQSEKTMAGMCMPDNEVAKTSEGMAGMDDTKMSMGMEVTDDKSFIEYTIPHHQDAIDSSKSLLQYTKDEELKTFLNKVITTQDKEIQMMKVLYKSFYNTEYKDNGKYVAMMVKVIPNNIRQSEYQYTKDMLAHHGSIVEIAKKVVTNTQRKYNLEIILLSQQIIKAQESDQIILQNWLDNKYKNYKTL